MKSLLQQIEDDALSSDADLADVLRKCIALGSRSGSDAMREWATHELKGYGGSTLPDYRIIPAVIAVDLRTSTQHITGYQIGVHNLPEPAQSTLREEVRLAGPIAEIVDAVESARRSNDDTVLFGVPGGTILVNLMNADRMTRGEYGQVIDRVYFKCSATSLVGILDTVRTNLVELIAEMRSVSHDSDSTPEKDAVDRAVEIVIHGGQTAINVASNNTISDSSNVVLAATDVTQLSVELPARGDIDALLDWLVGHGVPRATVDDLRDAIEADGAVKGTGVADPGHRVKAWLANATLNGASAIGTGVSVDLVAQALRHFFGI